jgi:ubiquitin C-terminal hydrolase
MHRHPMTIWNGKRRRHVGSVRTANDVLLSFSALQLSRETMEQMIDESDIAERKSPEEPAGLKNVGNTCWFNSIVQTLYTLPYFRRLILNFRYVSLNRTLTDSVRVLSSHTK